MHLCEFKLPLPLLHTEHPCQSRVFCLKSPCLLSSFLPFPSIFSSFHPISPPSSSLAVCVPLISLYSSAKHSLSHEAKQSPPCRQVSCIDWYCCSEELLSYPMTPTPSHSQSLQLGGVGKGAGTQDFPSPSCWHQSLISGTFRVVLFLSLAHFTFSLIFPLLCLSITHADRVKCVSEGKGKWRKRGREVWVLNGRYGIWIKWAQRTKWMRG